LRRLIRLHRQAVSAFRGHGCARHFFSREYSVSEPIEHSHPESLDFLSRKRAGKSMRHDVIAQTSCHFSTPLLAKILSIKGVYCLRGDSKSAPIV
jgi:hypothetical protein